MIQRLLSIWEGLKLTWDEVHMIISGLGDGFALRKGEEIPKLSDVKEKHDPCDFYAILAKEAWYYKISVGLGRLTWALIIASLLIRFIG